MGDGLHDVLRMRFGQPHVPRRAPVEPSAHGAKRALDAAPRPADPRVELLLARREPLPSGRPAHDAVLAPHALDRRPILRRGVARVGVDRDAPAQGPLEVPGVARVGRGGLLGEDHPVGVGHRAPLVAEAELPGLPDPARLPVHVRLGHLPEHGRRRGLAALLLPPVVHRLVLLAAAGPARAVGDARVDDGPALHHEPLGLQLPVDLAEHLVQRAGLGHGAAEPKHRGAVGRGHREAQPLEAAGGDAVVHHLLHPRIAQAVPNAQQLNLEKHEAIVARAARTGAQSMTLSICATLVSLVPRTSDKMSKRDVVLIGFFMVQSY